MARMDFEAEIKRLHEIIVWNYESLEKEIAELRAILINSDANEENTLKERVEKLEAAVYISKIKQRL